MHTAALARYKILDIAQTKRSPTILVASELANGGLGAVGVVEANDTSSL